MNKNVIISVYDKTEVVNFAQKISELGYQVLSTGGTARLLEERDVAVKKVSDYTGFQEILGGRVKTLHPKIHAGILANRDKEEDIRDMKNSSYDLIDIVVVNLYPFEETIAKEGVTLEEAVEQIDIGGVTLLRAAAKNFKHVAIISEPEDYNMILEKLEKHNEIDLKTRKELAVKAFKKTMAYDTAISNYLENQKIL